MMKNAFILSEEVLSFPRYLKFCSEYMAMYQNGLIRQISLNLKFMTPRLA